MNRYRPTNPRAAFALGALALSTLTLAILVQAPASLEPSADLLATRGDVPASRIEVIGSRHDLVALATAMPHVDR